jgi:hypothetical protein
MSKRSAAMGAGIEQGLEFVSHGRAGPSQRIHFGQEQIAQMARTVRRVPEVLVKVSGGGREVGAVKAHLSYIDRHGKLELETDDGRTLTGKEVAEDLVSDWNLDLSRGQYRRPPVEGEQDKRPKLVHNIVLSMPGRTPGHAVLAAARQFARENFALQYRYAVVLHTDQAHPHVHLVVKAEHETQPGKRLHIRKATLRQWREDFAQALRDQGVAANATPAAARGAMRNTKKDPIHQRLKAIAAYERLPDSTKQGRAPPMPSTFMTAKVLAVAKELAGGNKLFDSARSGLVSTRKQVAAAWQEAAMRLRSQGEMQLAKEVEEFVADMPRVQTEKESIARGLIAQVDAIRAGQGRSSAPEGQEQ